VIDGAYRGKLGDLVLEAADLVVWLDLPLWVWLPRLARRSLRRIRGHEELWNGNRETFRDVFLRRDALVPFALRTHVQRRRRYPEELARFPVVRLRTTDEVARFAAAIS
jgi:hypothetical protein